jgi:hypothetical protein
MQMTPTMRLKRKILAIHCSCIQPNTPLCARVKGQPMHSTAMDVDMKATINVVTKV